MKNRLLYWIKKRKLTQREFASRIGVPENHVSRWCRNHVQPGRKNLKNILTLLQITLSELYE